MLSRGTGPMCFDLSAGFEVGGYDKVKGFGRDLDRECILMEDVATEQQKTNMDFQGLSSQLEGLFCPLVESRLNYI